MPYRHFSREDRIRLSALLKAGFNIRRCAQELGFSPAAVYKEVKRNGGREDYRPGYAQRRYLTLRKEANQCHRILGENTTLFERVKRLLMENWSPEQVIGRYCLEYGYKLCSFTTLYNYINPRPELHYLLPRKGDKYRRTREGNKRKEARKRLDSRRSIDERPDIVNRRERLGDWEGDTMIGKERKSRILTLTERASGYLLAELLEKVSARGIREASVRLFKDIPEAKKQTITYDNGLEFAEHELTEKQTHLKAFFAHPYHSWERGTNENTNGLIRRYFPQGTVFSKIDLDYFKRVIEKLNHRPRKRLGYRTPFEVFFGVNLRIVM